MARDPLSRQILISGRIVDGLTGGRPRGGPVVEVDGPPGLLLRAGADGVYAISVQPDIAMPRPGDRITLSISADGYQATTAQILLDAGHLTRLDLAVPLGGEIAELPHFPNLPVTLDLLLLPQPVALKGRVAEADDPALALAGATVRVTAPVPIGPVQTDASGYFSLPAVPVAAAITLRITAPDHVAQDFNVRPDFSLPINHGAFALSSI